MEQIVIRSSRSKASLATFISLLFVAGGVFVLAGNGLGGGIERTFAGWGAVTFFGGCSLVGLWQFLDSRPRLVIDDEGIFDRTLGCGKIPWTDIVASKLQTLNGQNFISLELRNEDHYLRNVSSVRKALIKSNKALGFSAFNLNLSLIHADANEVDELISRRIRSAQ